MAASRHSPYLILILVLTSGCGAPQNPDALLARAIELRAGGDLNGAIVELKNAAQLDPQNGETRRLLGETHIARGDYESAFKELDRARKLGVSGDGLFRSITRALVFTGRFDEAATELAIHGDTAKLEWMLLQALIDLGVGRFEEANQGFAVVLAREPDNQEARRGQIRASIRLGEIEQAQAAIDSALAVAADDAMVWAMKGDLHLFEQDYKAAEQAYRRAIAIESQHYAARLGLISTLAAQKQFSDASEQIEALPKIAEQDPRVFYLRGLVAEGRGRPELATKHYRAVLLRIPDHRDSLLKLADLHFRAGEHTQSIEYMKQLTALDPANERYRARLGAAQLAAGRLDSAIVELDALGDIEQQTDARLLALLGSAYLREGQLSEGDRSLERAHELEPDSLPIQTQLALSKLRNGQTDEALTLLAAVRQKQPNHKLATVLTVLALAAAQRSDEATAVAGAFVADNPQDPLGYNVLGFVEQSLGQTDSARQRFEKAAEIDPSFHPARFNLARIAKAEGDLEAAEGHLRAVLDVEPHQADALLGLASLARERGDTERAVRWWESARQNNPEAAVPRVMLARHYRQNSQAQLAKAIIDEAFKLAPYMPAAQYEYALIHLLSGESEQAMPALNKLGARFPDSPVVHKLFATAYRMQGDSDAYRSSLERLGELDPSDVRPRLGLASLAMSNGQLDEALAIATQLLQEKGHEAVGYELRGDVYRLQSKLPQALEAYSAAFEQSPDSKLVLKLDAVERQLGRTSDRLVRWLEQHPDDRLIRFQRATNTLGDGDNEQAVRTYEELLAQQPDNPVLLNNLAWIYLQRKDERALPYAERAHELRPDNPQIMDTLGWVLLNNGKIEQAFKILQMAIESAPQNADIRYHYANALAEVGQHALALRELDKVLADDHPPFESRQAAQDLYSSLQDPGP